MLLVGALVLSIVLCHRRAIRRDQITGRSQTVEVHELSGSRTPSYHVPALKGEKGSARGLYVRLSMLLSVTVEP